MNAGGQVGMKRTVLGVSHVRLSGLASGKHLDRISPKGSGDRPAIVFIPSRCPAHEGSLHGLVNHNPGRMVLEGWAGNKCFEIDVVDFVGGQAQPGSADKMVLPLGSWKSQRK